MNNDESRPPPRRYKCWFCIETFVVCIEMLNCVLQVFDLVFKNVEFRAALPRNQHRSAPAAGGVGQFLNLNEGPWCQKIDPFGWYEDDATLVIENGAILPLKKWWFWGDQDVLTRFRDLVPTSEVNSDFKKTWILY